MENKKYIEDSELETVFKNRIIQYDNFNSNSELFINGDDVYKIYYNNMDCTNYNINVIRNIFKNYHYLNNIPELVLPKEWIVYNNKIVGFSMPYINGTTIEEINNNPDSNYDIKKIFINLLATINKFENLPFDFSIGDLHEKNVLIDNEGNIKIIDPDSFIINNEKLCVDGVYLMGKYANNHYNNEELKTIKRSVDYYSLLCIILNSVFKDMIEDKLQPVKSLKEDEQFKEIHPILNKVNDNFILLEEDINKIFEFKAELNYIPKNNSELEEEIKRIKKLIK